MNILVIGSGGREHALVWKLKQSTNVTNLFVAPGNAGTHSIATNIPLTEMDDILMWIEKNSIDLVVVGPDRYLAKGIVDKLQEKHVRVFGPTRSASEIEWSKSFAKQFMLEEGIPTAAFRSFTDITDARAYLESQRFPVVIKASGLAAGKGVVIAGTLTDAERTLKAFMEERLHGDAGKEVIIEEFLTGTEISIHALSDGTDAILFPPSQDHKRIHDGDLGANTGGMGTVAPFPMVTAEQIKEIEEKIIKPTIRALRRRGRPFLGILFPGIMLTTDGPKVIEFNARFGDPETQSYMRILKTDLVELLLASIMETVSSARIEWEQKSVCSVVLASGGYPGSYRKGARIHGLKDIEQLKDVVIFHAGTRMEGEAYLTDGGRVLNISATADMLKEALWKAYSAVGNVYFEGMQFRTDIGQRALNKR